MCHKPNQVLLLLSKAMLDVPLLSPALCAGPPGLAAWHLLSQLLLSALSRQRTSNKEKLQHRVYQCSYTDVLLAPEELQQPVVCSAFPVTCTPGVWLRAESMAALRCGQGCFKAWQAFPLRGCPLNAA